MYTRPPANDLMMYGTGLPAPAQRRQNWWLRLTSMPADPRDTSFESYERARRSRLASWLFLGMFVVLLLIVPLAVGSLGTAVALLGVFVGIVIAIICNRVGWITASAIVLIIMLTAGIFGSVISEPNGLTMFDLPAYDALMITVIMATSILPAISGFFVAAINAVLIVLDFTLQPHAADVVANEKLYGSVALLARPIAFLLIVAVVAYLWVQGTHREIKRANRAEEVAALEHAYGVQRQQLEIGVQQILATHVRIANGDYNARAPLSQDHALWQIASSLNNLVSRFRTIAEQTNRVGYQLQRTEEEVHRLAMALRDLQGGRRPIWPAPSRTAVDELLPILAGRDRKPPTLPPASSWEAEGGGGQLGQGWASPAGSAAPTPPPMSGGGWSHNPPRFGPPLTDSFRQPNSAPRPDSTGSTGQMLLLRPHRHFPPIMHRVHHRAPLRKGGLRSMPKRSIPARGAPARSTVVILVRLLERARFRRWITPGTCRPMNKRSERIQRMV